MTWLYIGLLFVITGVGCLSWGIADVQSRHSAKGCSFRDGKYTLQLFDGHYNVAGTFEYYPRREDG